MNTPKPMIQSLLLTGGLLLAPLALAQDEPAEREAMRAELQAEREAMRAELQAARAELAEAARRMAQLQRQMVEEGAQEGRWRMQTDGGEDIEIIIDSETVTIDPEHDLHFISATPKLGILVSGSDDDNEVLGLTPGGGAEAAGLQRGDRVVRVNGVQLGGENTIGKALQGVDAGSSVPVVVQRGNQELGFDVETSAPERDIRVFAQRFGPGSDFDFDIDMEALQEGLEGMQREIVMIHEGEMPFPPDAPHAPHPPRLPGLFVLGGDSDLVSNHEGLAPYFGTGDGVVVLRIADENALQLQDGDVILTIDGEAVSRPVDLGRAMLDREAGDTVILEVMRNGTLTQVEGTVPESRFPAVHIKREVGLNAPPAFPHAPHAPRPARPPRPAAPEAGLY